MWGQARAAIKAGNLAELAEQDELQRMMKEQRAFQGWQEGQLTFPPTFKFKLGSPSYIGKLLANKEGKGLPDRGKAILEQGAHSASS